MSEGSRHQSAQSCEQPKSIWVRMIDYPYLGEPLGFIFVYNRDDELIRLLEIMLHTMFRSILLRIFCCFITTLIMGTTSTTAIADGKAFVFDRTGYRVLPEREQRVCIAYQDGIEHMVLSIQLDFEVAQGDVATGQSLWLFPVQAESVDDVHIELFDQVPALRGMDEQAQLRRTIDEITLSTSATLMFPGCLFPSLGRARGGADFTRGAIAEQWGMHAEVVDADDTDSLIAFVESQDGPSMKAIDWASMQPYMNDEHVFIAVWMIEQSEFAEHFASKSNDDVEGSTHSGLERWPSVYVSFPTEKMFFPLQPTASYGEEKVPLTAYILNDFVEVECDDADLQTKGRVAFFGTPSGQVNIPASMRSILGWPSAESTEAQDHRIRYSRVMLNTKAEQYTADYFFNPVEASGWVLAEKVNRILDSSLAVRIGIIIGWVLLWSYIAAGVSGLVFYKRWRGCASLGFANLLTIIMFAYVAYRRLPTVLAIGQTGPATADSLPNEPIPPVRSFQLASSENSLQLIDEGGASRPSSRYNIRLAGFVLLFVVQLLIYPLVMRALLLWPFQ